MKITKIVEEDILNIIKDNELDKLKDSTFLITGINGMIGRYFFLTIYFLNKAFNKKHKVYGLDLKFDDLNNKIFDEMKGNFFPLEQNVTEKIKIDEKLDYIIHTAGPASPKYIKMDPIGTNLANTLGAINTLELADRDNVKGYLFISSREVYGEKNEGQEYFTENGKLGYIDHTNVRNAYAESKKNAENLICAYNQQKGLNGKAIRLTYTFGPGINIHDGRVQSDFFKNFVNNEDIVMKSLGLSLRTYTYLADAVSAMYRILMKSDKNDIIFNVSDLDNQITIRGLAETVVSFNKDLKLVIDVEEDKTRSYAPFSDGILVSEKLKDLGYKKRCDVKMAVERTLKHLKEENSNEEY